MTQSYSFCDKRYRQSALAAIVLLTLLPFSRASAIDLIGLYVGGAIGQARYPLVVTFTADLTPFAGGPLALRFHGEVRASAHPNHGIYLDDVYVIEPRVEHQRASSVL